MKKINPVGFVLLLAQMLILSGCDSGLMSEATRPASTATPTLLLSPRPTSIPTDTPTPSPTVTPTSTNTPSVPPLSPTTATTLELVGHLGGNSLAIVGYDHTLYLGDGTELAILDVSDPTQPRRIGYVVLPDLVTDIYVAGDVAYVKVDNSGLHVVDVSEPGAPVDLGQINIPQATGRVVVKGNIAYFATGESGLAVFDVSAPAAPTELFYFKTSKGAWEVRESGDYLYVSNETGLAIIDVSDPIRTVELGSIDLPGPFQDMAVVGNTAYVADAAALRIFDISEPVNPTELSFFATSSYMEVIYNNPGVGPGCSTTSMVVTGIYAYLNGCDGNQILDISNPERPTRAGSFDNVAGSMKLALNGYGYVLGPASVHILNLANPVAPKEVGAYRTPAWWVWDMAVAGNYVYVTGPDNGLQVISIANPANPATVGFYQTPSLGFGQGVAVHGNYVYAVDNKALRVLDMSDPNTPVEVSLIKAPVKHSDHEFSRVEVVDDYVYAVGRFRDAFLWIVDVSDPTAPVEVSSSYSLPYGAVEITVVDHHAIILTTDGLAVIDISNPTAPTQAGFYSIPGVLWSSLAVSGNYAYLGAMYPHDLRVIDISDPTAPVEVGRYTPAGDGRAVAVEGSFAYVLDEYRRGLRVVDISDPTTPTQAAFYELPNPTHFDKIAVANGYIYTGAGGAGLYILRHNSPVE